MADRYWIGGDSGDENSWENADNWAATSGGAAGAGIPTASDDVIFDDGSAYDCLLSAEVSFLSLDVQDTYVNDLKQLGNTMNCYGDCTLDSGGEILLNANFKQNADGTVTSNGFTFYRFIAPYFDTAVTFADDFYCERLTVAEGCELTFLPGSTNTVVGYISTDWDRTKFYSSTVATPASLVVPTGIAVTGPSVRGMSANVEITVSLGIDEGGNTNFTFAVGDDAITDYADRAQKLLVTQFRDKPKLKAFIDAFMNQVQEIEYELYKLKTLRWLDTASGVQLDKLGDLLDVSRLGMSDANYRIELKLKVYINHSHGTADYLLAYLKDITGATAVSITENFPAGFSMRTNGKAILGIDIVNLIERVAAAGVEIESISYGDPDFVPFGISEYGENGGYSTDGEGFLEYGYDEITGSYDAGALTEKFA